MKRVVFVIAVMMVGGKVFASDAAEFARVYNAKGVLEGLDSQVLAGLASRFGEKELETTRNNAAKESPVAIENRKEGTTYIYTGAFPFCDLITVH